MGNSTSALTALVTGSAKGIGKAIAYGLANNGITVIALDYDEISLRESIKAYDPKNGSIEPAIFNLEDINGLNNLVKGLIGKYGKIDILVNNAGIISRTPLMEVTEQEWDRVMNINLKSLFFLSREVLKFMLENSFGRILNMSSLSAKRGGVTSGINYGVSKAGVISVTKYLAKYATGKDVLINTLVPGFVETEMYLSNSEDQKKSVENSIPLKRVAKPEEIADAVKFLVSEKCTYINGATVDINGGVYMS